MEALALLGGEAAWELHPMGCWCPTLPVVAWQNPEKPQEVGAGCVGVAAPAKSHPSKDLLVQSSSEKSRGL